MTSAPGSLREMLPELPHLQWSCPQETEPLNPN